MEMEEQAVLEHQRGYLRHHERVQNIVEQQIRDSLNLHHARLQEQGHARRQREQERRYEEERRYEREQAWQPQALRRDQQLEDERRVHRFMHQKNLQEQNPNPIPKPTPKPKQEPLMKQEPKQKPTPKPTPKPKQEQVPQQQKPQQKPQQEQKQKQKQKQKKPQDQNQDQQQPLTIADLCQQCNLHFCDVLHHVAIIAKASKSQPSSNHKGYKHDDLVGAYSTFRHACQRLNAHGREEEAVERRITQDPEFFVSNLKLALKSVVKALEECKFPPFPFPSFPFPPLFFTFFPTLCCFANVLCLYSQTSNNQTSRKASPQRIHHQKQHWSRTRQNLAGPIKR